MFDSDSQTPSRTDAEVGQRVRRERVSAGLTQQQLAERSGVTYQQVHKYETGQNRISAGRLARIAAALNVSVAELMDERAEKERSPHEGKLRATVRDLRALSPEHLAAVAPMIRAFAAQGAAGAPAAADA